MSTLYVYALADAPLRNARVVAARIQSLAVGPVFALCEQRTASPALTEKSLRHQHAIIQRIAEVVPAVLPARFGSLVTRAELEAILHQRETFLVEALEIVRGAVQMTLRFREPDVRQPVGRTIAAENGRAYLARKAAEHVTAPLPASRLKMVQSVASFVRQERREAQGTAVYHLIARGDVEAYRAALPESADMSVSGPWAPFAFAPQLW